jgi:hypothetical protein
MRILEIHPKDCSFSWEKLMEMKEHKIEFWAGDGLTRLRILDADMRQRTIHMITHKGEKTWPLKFQKLENIHNRIHNGVIAPIAYEIDKYAPMWGNNIKGLLQHLGCLATLRDVSWDGK